MSTPPTQTTHRFERAPASRQPLLLEVEPCFRLTTPAQARTAYGALAQELACAALGLLPVPITGSARFCPDAEDHTGRPYEIKSVRHNGGKVVVYDCRMAKEAELAPHLIYVLAVHQATPTRQLKAVDYTANLELWLIPAAIIHTLAQSTPLRHLVPASSDPRNGYTRIGYCDGYRALPLTRLRHQCGISTLLPYRYCGRHYECGLRTTQLYDRDTTNHPF